LLGRDDRDANGRAVHDLTAGLAALPAEQRATEWAAEYELQLARAFAKGDDRMSAERALEEVRAIANATGSARLRGEAEELARQLGF